jgi:hypothetical protein
MSHKDTPYPFDGMPDEDYFGELRELSNTIAQFDIYDKSVPNKKNNADGNADKKSDSFNEFSIFPMD